MPTVYLGLGSNLGEREANLRAALERLDADGVRILRASSLYETEPRDFTDQPWFLNMAAEAETRLLPRTLLTRILRIEANLGRRRTVAKGPRVIDIDILLYGANAIDTSSLTIPHPAMAERRFVLEPLAELWPDLVHPVTGLAIRRMLAGVEGQKVRRLTKRIWDF